MKLALAVVLAAPPLPVGPPVAVSASAAAPMAPIMPAPVLIVAPAAPRAPASCAAGLAAAVQALPISADAAAAQTSAVETLRTVFDGSLAAPAASVGAAGSAAWSLPRAGVSRVWKGSPRSQAPFTMPSALRVKIVPGRSRGSFTPALDWPLGLQVLSVLFFFVGAAAGGFSGAMSLAFIAVLVANLVGMGASGNIKAGNAALALAAKNARILSKAAASLGPRAGKDPYASLVYGRSAARREALQKLADEVQPGDAPLAAFLADLAVAETVPENVAAAIAAIGRIGGRPAEAALDLARGGLPSVFEPAIASARAAAAAADRQASAVAAAAELAEEPDLADKAAVLLQSAERSAARLESAGSLPEVLRARVLRERRAELDAARRIGDRDAMARLAAALELLIARKP